MRWIEIKYKCRCMLKERDVLVVARSSGEDILDFMERMQKSIGKDHRQQSPFCQATKMEYAKIPIEDDEIGSAKGGTA